MKCLVFLTVLVFASKNENDIAERLAENAAENITENSLENLIVVKIEEDDYVKKKNSNYFGVRYNENRAKWRAYRWSKVEKQSLTNGEYKCERIAAHASDTLARKLLRNGEQNHNLNFPDDSTEVYPEKKTKHSKFFGVFFNEKSKRWLASRWSKIKKKHFNNRTYKDEETAAHASDTLARKLMAYGEEHHKLNFPDDKTEVHPVEKAPKSKHIGVTYNEKFKKWVAQRWSKTEKKLFNNGYHKSEETAAQASDTLARKLMTNGEPNLKLNFPDDSTEVHPKEITTNCNYIGVYYKEKSKRWYAQRWSKKEHKPIHNGSYRDEETAAHASDTLARKLMLNGEQNLKLNFPDDNTEVHTKHQRNKRKRSFDFEYSQANENNFEKFEEKEK